MRGVPRDLLARRDPQGYYVIPLRKCHDVLDMLERLGAEYEEAGDVIYARVKSRSIAARIASWAARRGLLAAP